jgi:hypothetical protein
MSKTAEAIAIEDGNAAFVAIEDDLLLVESAANVLHMLYVNLERRDGSRALADSVWFTARGIEGAVARIKSRLRQRPCSGTAASGQE